MATYSAIAATEYQAGKPITTNLGGKWSNNLTATMEGATGAPKVALKTDSGSFTATAVDFNSIGAWSGTWFNLTAFNSGGVGRDIKVDATDDGGSTYLGSVVIHTLAAGLSVNITGFLDFSTGVVHGSYVTSAAAGVFSQTIAGASTSIDGVRFVGSTDITGGVIVNHNGGESAT